jgi:hypothetical protein
MFERGAYTFESGVEAATEPAGHGFAADRHLRGQ